MEFNWPKVRLGDHVDSCLGKMLDKQKNKGVEQPYLGNSNVRWGEFDLSDLAQMKFEEHEHERYGIKPGDLIVCEGGEPGRCAIWEGELPEMKIQKALHRVRAKPSFNNRYLYYWFLYAGQHGLLEPYFTGTTIKHLSGRALSNLVLPQPPIGHQEFMASILGSIDKKIQLNHRINNTLQQMAQALFKSWFVDFDPVKAKVSVLEAGGSDMDALLAAMEAISGKTADQLALLRTEQSERFAELRATAALFPSAMQESELGEIPEGWEVTSIGKIAEVIKGKSYKSAELSSSNTALVTLKSFNRGGGYRLDGLKEYTGKYKPKQEVFAGDLIIAYTDVTQAADVIGKPALVVSDSRYEHLVVSLDVAVIRPFEEKLKPYLYGLAGTDGFQSHTRAYTTGTTVLHLDKNAVPDYQFSMPSKALAEAYERQVSPLFSLIDQKIQEARSLASLRDTLLPELLSGELEAPSAETKIAEVANA
ncbi:restriction endonuclease subunit S [Modicisalibacter luteus]|uniref:Restriction endonuclease subunit S n=2 Tax=Modicisalibacter luteus TaxID=453962 RepID=A0ABV7LYJ5_9GAMM|nr:restriction endonuclease subunit S [Halomonas lutea]GHB00979.1 type I restriction-modification system subunit S [Halomonas lutea]